MSLPSTSFNEDLSTLTLEDVWDMMDCECGEYGVCDECRDSKWSEGLCYGCLSECDMSSQMCGRCARSGW